MPQPIRAIVSDPHIVLDTKALADKPEFALLVCEIFATWASIERQLNGLLVRMIGANATSAHAIFSILQAQHLQTKALESAARAALDDNGFGAFRAYMRVIDSVQKTRNKLAHWSWGKCKQRPDLLILADPKMLKERDHRSAAYFQSAPANTFNAVEVWMAIHFDDSYIFAFTKDDLERDLRDLRQADELSNMFASFLDPSLGLVHPEILGTQLTAEEIRSATLANMMKTPLFKESMEASKPKPP